MGGQGEKKEGNRKKSEKMAMLRDLVGAAVPQLGAHV